MLLVSTGIGIYHGLYKKQKNATDYLLGGKQMTVAPITMSLITSSLSGLTLLSLPADIYRYGITLLITSPLHIIILIISCYIYVPVFYNLQITSIYEYFKIRYNNKIRMLASFLYVVHMMFLLPIFIYIPSLALSQVSGVYVHYIAPAVCSVCIFYTTLGGIKAAIWSDALQFTIMFGSLVIVLVVGITGIGGIGAIFNKAFEGGRMDISYNFSITERDTIWTATFGSFFAFLNHFATNQGFIQKCLTLPSYGNIKVAIFFATIGIVIITGLSMFSGLVMFAYYFGCDPLKLNIITTYDQLLPNYVMEISNFIPGLPGLFISGIFSASLSSLSASLNCMSGAIYHDFIAYFVPKDISQEIVSRYLKIIVVILGIICTILVYLVERLGSLLALTLSISAFSGGPLFGLFTAGMLIPMVHSKGAYYGGLISLVVTGWMVVGSQVYKFIGVIQYSVLPVSIDACNITDSLNQTLDKVIIEAVKPITDQENDPPFILYRISFYYYTMIGACIAIFASVLISYFTERDKPLNRECLAPIVKAFVKDEPPQYSTIDKAKKIVNHA
ncbi:hypothetical protein Trydic_g17025 [Trypoxylus dichotomus]